MRERTNAGERIPTTAGLALFEQPAVVIPGCPEPASHREKQIDALVAFTRTLRAKYPQGLTVAEIRYEAGRVGILTGKEIGRELSFIWIVPRKAGMIALDQNVRSFIPKTHGNRNTWYVWP